MTFGLFIPELGQLAMILALCFAIVQAIVPLLGAWRGDKFVDEPGATCRLGAVCLLAVFVRLPDLRLYER